MADLLEKHSRTARRLTGLLVSAGIIFFLLPTALTTGTATDEVTQTRLENGSFEIPQIDQSKDLTDSDKAGGKYWFVKLRSEVESIAQSRHQTGFYWNTTAYNTGVGTGKIELAYKENRSQYGAENAAEGEQYAELCAVDQASLYQNLKTDPGTAFHWSLSHAARNGDANNGTETMALFIGAKQTSPLYKKGKGKGDTNDIFMWMARLLKETGRINIDTSTTQEGMIPLTVYSKNDINVQEENISTDSTNEHYYRNYFSLTPTDEISKEWKCWIITTHKNSGWVNREGIYDVPAGQTETTFAFTALTGKSTDGNTINEGNLLDNVVFEKQYPLRVTTTGGGTGRVYTRFDPKTPDSESNELAHEGEFVTETQNHFERYNDGTRLTIRATPNQGYTFSGAYIDGAFHWATETEYFTPLTAAAKQGITYYQNITMDKARYIQLVYTKDSTIIFDPNGGVYNGKTANTEVQMNSESEHSAYTSTAASHSDPGIRFIGWYIGPFPISSGSSMLGALIGQNVHIQYQAASDTAGAQFETKYKYVDTEPNTEKTIRTEAEKGLTFIARWEYKQTAMAMTMERTATGYENNTNGGMVQITALEGDLYGSDQIASREVETVNDNDQPVQNGGKISSGYARITDKVTMKAEPKDGYVFRGWYENDRQISASTTFSYELGSGVRTIEARFRAVLQYPYLSFVSQDEYPDTTEKPFKDGTSLKVGENEVEGYGGMGRDIYGSTISTGFSTVQTFNNITYDSCLWTITIPAVSAAADSAGNKPLYVKSAEPLPDSMNAEAVLTDQGDVQYNSGTIYKVNQFDGQNIRLKASLPTMTIESGGQAVFAVILDNIYAPGAYAMLDLLTPEATPAPGASPDPNATPAPYDLNGISYTYNADDTSGYRYYSEKYQANSSTQNVD